MKVDTDTRPADTKEHWLIRADSIVTRLFEYVLIVLFVIMLIAAVAQVTSREFGLGLTGSEEVARFAMVASAFIAIPVLTRSRSQIAVDALGHFLPSTRSKMALARVILVIELLFLLIFINYSYLYAMELVSTGQTSVALTIPYWVPASALPLGALFGAIVTAIMLVTSFRSDHIGDAIRERLTT